MKSSSNRHRLSTLLASMDISPRDRELFYKHMGHSEKINQKIYQAPAAIMEIIKVGKHVKVNANCHLVCVVFCNLNFFASMCFNFHEMVKM